MRHLILIFETGDYMMCTKRCAKKVLGLEAAIGVTIAASGSNIIPTRTKLKGSTPGTSVASKIARKVFKNKKFKRKWPAPTQNKITLRML